MQARKYVLSEDDIVLAKGTDTFCRVGRSMSSLAMQRDTRANFFKQRPTLKPLLLSEPENPTMEEGRFSKKAREHEGEYYLTYDAIKVLIESKIRPHQINGSNNIYVSKNDQDALLEYLKATPLKDGEDIKFIYIHGIHAIPCYLRNINNKIHCLILDSQGDTSVDRTLIDQIKKIYPECSATSNSTILQKDYYSCATFAIKALLYFVKHGDEIFPYINKKLGEQSSDKVSVLNHENLMPNLLKMYQGTDNLPEETLNTIVSYKKQHTLRDYHQQHRISVEGRFFNRAALEKKYGYFDEISTYTNSAPKI